MSWTDDSVDVLNPHNMGSRGLTTIILVAIIVIIIAVVGIGAAFALSSLTNPSTTSHQSTSVSMASSTSIATSSHSIVSSSTAETSLSQVTSSVHSTLSTSTRSSSQSYHGSVGFNPSCFVLYSGGVYVYGNTSNASVKSVQLWWSYHAKNKWYPLNDLVLGSNFNTDGNFSHMWNPPSAAYYDFKANWTLSNGGIITAITSKPFQVVSQGSTCP